MKKISLLTLFLFAVTIHVSAQAPWKAQKRKLSSLSLTVSPFSETLSGLSQIDILGMVEDPSDRIDMEGFEKASGFTTTMTGENINIKLGFAKQVRNNLLAELQVGFSAQTYGELVLDYNNNGQTGDESFSSIGLCYMHNRAGLSLGYKLRGYGGRSSFSFGPTITGAKTFNDLVLYIGGTNANGEVIVDARSATITKFNFDIDYAFRIVDNLALNLGGTYGYTYFISQNIENSLGNNYSLNIGFEYQFFRRKFDK